MPERAPHCAVVPPVADGEPRPTWSVMIPTFHCARFLGRTLASVLAQDPGPAEMQIEVVDDHSTADDPESVVRAVGGGRVGFHRQPANAGHVRNFATCLARARGRLVHLLHGDDWVLDGFYVRLGAAFAARPDVGAAFCRPLFADAGGTRLEPAPVEEPVAGVLPDALARLAAEQRVMTPAIVVRRDVYEALGAFDERLVCAEDWEMWVRIAAAYPVWYEPEALAVYRMHDDSNTGRHVRNADDARYNRLAIELFARHLPPHLAGVAARARETYALAALDTAAALLARGDVAACLAQAREALRLRRSPRVLRRLLRLAAGAVPGRAARGQVVAS